MKPAHPTPLQGSHSASDPEAKLAVAAWLLTQLTDWVLRWCQPDTTHGISLQMSDRERACLQLAAQGKDNKQIAACLCISGHTVAFHINNATKKLGVNTRAAAISKATHAGQLLDSALPHYLRTELTCFEEDEQQTS